MDRLIGNGFVLDRRANASFGTLWSLICQTLKSILAALLVEVVVRAADVVPVA